VAVLGAGALVAEGDPRDVLADSALFAPQVARVFPGTGWLTPEDATASLGGGPPSQR
jgi:energy-coupling factor transport system ATP-binding protein